MKKPDEHLTFQNQPTEKLVQILKNDSVHSIYLHKYLYKEQLLLQYLWSYAYGIYKYQETHHLVLIIMFIKFLLF